MFFAKRGVTEVDVPLLSRSASVDAHIDLVEATCMGTLAFLHSSPEYGMKRLLSKASGDIYQISHVFRDGERGERHNPEFTMVEWYRVGISFQEMIEETVAFVRLFVKGKEGYEMMTYEEAFRKTVGEFPDSLEERDALFSFEVEPQLGKHQVTVIAGFPKEQAALAQIESGGLAERFEVFVDGLELANGYHELADVQEQRERLEEGNKERERMGKRSYPVDEGFMQALEQGLPDCCGVAVGFDRLLMLAMGVDRIGEVLPFPWEEA
ncbi:MAG: Elongation factor P--(R)-beta-lysine ligase [Chlamydiae bacterium]|nr:Elongation factor P--(R)-beta-lysine ligase [Chlamydiota bacterium]